MMTYEMVGVADQNNRTYQSQYGTYSKKDGFIINPYCINFSFHSKSIFSFQKLLNKLFHENCWSIKEEKQKPKKMTKEEIEKELGYKIDIQDNNVQEKNDKYITTNSDDWFDDFLYWTI